MLRRMVFATALLIALVATPSVLAEAAFVLPRDDTPRPQAAPASPSDPSDPTPARRVGRISPSVDEMFTVPAALGRIETRRSETVIGCPVDGPIWYTNDWGQPRSGGRRHQGIDLFAARGTPTVALTDGVIESTAVGALGGRTVRLRADDGTAFYYAHHDQVVVTRGQRVSAGEMLGRVGTTGNARGTSPHLHFEIRPDGRTPVPPFETIVELCGPSQGNR